MRFEVMAAQAFAPLLVLFLLLLLFNFGFFTYRCRLVALRKLADERRATAAEVNASKAQTQRMIWLCFSVSQFCEQLRTRTPWKGQLTPSNYLPQIALDFALQSCTK